MVILFYRNIYCHLKAEKIQACISVWILVCIFCVFSSLGGTSDLFTGGTSDSFSTGRLAEENSPAAEANLDVVRDYSPTAASTSTSHDTLSQEPTVQRDFQADNIIIPQTVKPQGEGELQIPVLSLKETAGLVEDSSRPSPATIPNDLVVIRDHQTEEVVAHAPTSAVVSNSFVHSRLSGTQPSGVNVQTANTSPVPIVTSGNLEDLNVQRDVESLNLVQEIPTAARPNVTSGSDDVSNLTVARDQEEGSPFVPLTTTPDLVVIRDRVSEDDNGHILTTRGTDSPNSVSTKSIGNGILILLPGGGNK